MHFRKPARLRSWTWPLLSVIFVALLAAFFNPADPGITSPDNEYVQRVVDGDTLMLGTGERVRLIGVDTPETKHPNKPEEFNQIRRCKRVIDASGRSTAHLNVVDGGRNDLQRDQPDSGAETLVAFRIKRDNMAPD
jgi:hypothetical protein